MRSDWCGLTRRMQHPGEQTKIHFNPEFISRGRAPLNPKVHVNPAFLQKSQETFAAQNYVTPATAPTATITDHEQQWQGLVSGTSSFTTSHVTNVLPPMYHRNLSTHVYSHSSKSMNGPLVPSSINTKTSKKYTVPSSINTKTYDLYTKSSCTVPSSSTESHSLYSKNNIPYKSYNKSFSRCTQVLPQTQNIVAKNVTTGKHSSSYSWKASHAKIWSSSTQGDSSTPMDIHGNVNLVKCSELIKQRYTYPNPAMKYSSVNKSFITTTITRRIGVTQKGSHHNENKPAVSHSSLHSISHQNKSISHPSTNPVKITENKNPVKANPGKASGEFGAKVAGTETRVILALGKTTPGKTGENKCPTLHTSKVKNGKTAYEALASNTRGTVAAGEPEVPKSVGSKNSANKSSGGSASQTLTPGTTPKAARLTPSQKWVSKNKLVNSSYKKPLQTKAVDLNSSNNQVSLKTPKQKGSYKIITKTKLVRTNSNRTTKGKVQQQVSLAHCISPRVTNVTRSSKLSPALRAHTSTKLNGKRRYSVLSRTKLVRSQSQSGKVATPGKPKYSVNTKNKLVRRRSSSGSGGVKSLNKASESKAKVSKPEAERQRKFHVLSKTKIVRRRSSSGVYKAASSSGLVVSTPANHRKRAIVKRHKLVRNVSSAAAKQDSSKFNRRSFPKKVNTAFKVINISTVISPKQRVAKGIISKYKINRLKVDSLNKYRKHQKYIDYSSKARQKDKYKFQSKKECASKHSDRFINIGGILYKSTKTSLRKQLPKANREAIAKKPDITCTVFLRGEKFCLTAGGRTLKRVMDSPAAKTSLPRVHLGGLTYSRTKTGLYELTKSHQARALLSSARHRSVVTLMQKRRKALYQKRNENCVFFNRFGRCTKKDRGQCPYVHDPSRVAICTRFLRGRCPVNNCPFSHTIDPNKMPVCSHFLQTACTREDCPYRHVKVNPSAPVCLGFVRGHCKAGEECEKQHILICEEFKTGRCPRGASCPLSHHKGRKRQRKVSFSRDSGRQTSLSVYRKRRRSESLEILGGPVIMKRVEKKRRVVEPKSLQQRYFHVTAAEDSANKDANGEQIVLKEKMSGVTRTLNSDSDYKITMEVEDEELETQQDKVAPVDTNQITGSAEKSLLEETRSRVMKKVDQMKKCHLALSGDGLTEEASAPCMKKDKKEEIIEPRDCHQPSTAAKEKPSKSNDQVTAESSGASTLSCSDAENLSNSDQSTVQRPPLPKRLPSYIPLTLDES